MHSTKAGRVASSGLVEIHRSMSVSRLDMMSEEDKLMRGVGALKTEVTIAIKVL